MSAVSAKSLDGVNLDSSRVRAATTRRADELVATVSSALHAVDPHWQVSMDT